MAKQVLIKTGSNIILKQSQIALVQMAADGLNRKQIADKLGVSIRTIEMHFDNIRRTTGSTDIVSLVAFMFRAGVVK